MSLLSGERNQVTAILLAAGGSRRLGQPKQLVQFKNELLINYIINQIRVGGISEIRVVLGNHFSEIRDLIKSKDLEILENTKWEEGISSSIKCGLTNLKPHTQAAIIFTVDQPYLKPQLINEILQKFTKSNANIIATSVYGQLIPPVLYRKKVFPKLMKLKGDKGGKAIFGEENVEMVVWEDERLLIDIDSDDDLEKLNS